MDHTAMLFGCYLCEAMVVWSEQVRNRPLLKKGNIEILREQIMEDATHKRGTGA